MEGGTAVVPTAAPSPTKFKNVFACVRYLISHTGLLGWGGHGEYLCFACQGDVLRAALDEMPAADVEAEAKLKACSSTTVAAARDSINKKAGCDQWSELTPRAQLTICEVIASASDTPSRKKNRKRKQNQVRRKRKRRTRAASRLLISFHPSLK